MVQWVWQALMAMEAAKQTWHPAFSDTSLGALPEAEHAAFWAAMDAPPARGIRFRDPQGLAAAQAAFPGIGDPIPWAENAFYLDLDAPAGVHPLHAAGAYYLQEPSAMAAVSALDIHPGQRVLDLCASPGGKSTQIAALLQGEGVLVSNEIVPQRARVLSQNIERMGVCNAVVTNEPPDRLAARWPGQFDRILVDAPCSGEGMFRREPQTRAEWTPQSPKGCAQRQRQILAAAAEMLAPGGLLVYSTCTFNTEENEETIAAFAQANDAFTVEDFSLPGVGASQGGCLRLWPHRVKGEGHFVARLRKAGGYAAPPQTDSRVTLGDALPLFGSLSLPGTLHWAGDKAWIVPHGMPDLSGIRALRTGLALCERRGKMCLPDHASALAFPPEAYARHAPLNEDEARRFLRGDTLLREGCPAGWLVISHGGYGLGLAKCVEGVLKNHLPKGLRRM